MAVIKNEFPFLEYSTTREGIITPSCKELKLPPLCLLTFFGEVMNSFVDAENGVLAGIYRSSMGNSNCFNVSYGGTQICMIQAVVGSAIATMTDWLYAKGVETIICCGGCGVLVDIPVGEVIIPVRALRDEGASYKYLAPSRFIGLDARPVTAIKSVLEKHGVSYIEATTWTTDGLYRETRDMVEYRVSEGCITVEMECAAMAAVARYRNKEFGQLLYSGDILVKEYDKRNWSENRTAREMLFFLSLEALISLGGKSD
jgi:uridine phosphorylase